MSQEDFIRDSKERFSIVGPQTSEDEIEAVFPDAFPGREDLKQFYLFYNGGSRTELGGTVYCGNPEHRVSRDHLDEIRVEGLFAISHDPQKRMLGFHSMLGCRATRLRMFSAIPEMKIFLEGHMPIAFDHSGNYLWINLQNGHIQFLDWDAYGEGPVEIASSFQEFVTKYWIDPVLPSLE